MITLARHMLAAILCRLRYGRRCPHVPGLGNWSER